VRGNIVGRGVVLEIEDQGLGIENDRIEGLNAMLANPPDFGIMALSAEPRLGLFVVARLAARHGISVSLRESAYGGTRAIVLVRAELLAEVPQRPGDSTGRHDKPAENGAVLPVVKLPLPVADLPSLPLVEARPGEDLFRPQRPVDEPATTGHANGHTNGHANGTNGTNGANGSRGAHSSGPHRTGPPGGPPSPHPNGAHARPEPPTLTVPPLPSPHPRPPQPVGQLSADRPPLPQRRRQQNLAPQLRDEQTAAWPEETDREVSPDQARSRLSAYQRGTRQGREEPAPDNGFDGDDHGERR